MGFIVYYLLRSPVHLSVELLLGNECSIVHGHKGVRQGYDGQQVIRRKSRAQLPV